MNNGQATVSFCNPQAKIHHYPSAKHAPDLTRWHRLAAGLAHPAVELTVEEFAPIVAEYERLRRLGHAFDVMIVALMAKLARECGTLDDGLEDFDDELDASDQLTEDEDTGFCLTYVDAAGNVCPRDLPRPLPPLEPGLPRAVRGVADLLSHGLLTRGVA